MIAGKTGAYSSGALYGELHKKFYNIDPGGAQLTNNFAINYRLPFFVRWIVSLSNRKIFLNTKLSSLQSELQNFFVLSTPWLVLPKLHTNSLLEIIFLVWCLIAIVVRTF
jgi:hypothetical protein